MGGEETGVNPIFTDGLLLRAAKPMIACQLTRSEIAATRTHAF